MGSTPNPNCAKLRRHAGGSAETPDPSETCGAARARPAPRTSSPTPIRRPASPARARAGGTCGARAAREPWLRATPTPGAAGTDGLVVEPPEAWDIEAAITLLEGGAPSPLPRARRWPERRPGSDAETDLLEQARRPQPGRPRVLRGRFWRSLLRTRLIGGGGILRAGPCRQAGLADWRFSLGHLADGASYGRRLAALLASGEPAWLRLRRPCSPRAWPRA